MTTVLNDALTTTPLRGSRPPIAHSPQPTPGDPIDRQPVHTVYGGRSCSRTISRPKLGAAGLRGLAEYAPDFCTFARARASGAENTGPAAERAQLEGGSPRTPRRCATSEPRPATSRTRSTSACSRR